MQKPRVFVGSSSEGLPIAEAVFAHLSHEMIPKIWTNDLFLPGYYPLEVLESEIRRSDFAILVASPDDEVVKRDIPSPAMRDNLLLEFGLFYGALGKRRAFFVCPNSPRIELPSDLFGVITATYDAARVQAGADERAAAVQVACQQIREVVRRKWEEVQRAESASVARVRKSHQLQAVERLHTAAARFRDTLVAVQRDAFAAFSDELAFEQIKDNAVTELDSIMESLGEDARSADVEDALKELHGATKRALLDLPFPRELSIGRGSERQRGMDLGMQVLNGILSGEDPYRSAERVTAQEVSGTLASLRVRYSEWWDRHGPALHAASGTMQDRLLDRTVRIAREDQKN
ncbi:MULTISPECIES: nucleotide-binding protein [Streptomyces]|uniref:nucleotide-binding protein n=1 Tax=Streptomyces TaxID=1883 RepID=UPI0029B258BA|nr:nucleotide-binding protein [Streptomyces europaeiscabiei]MDX3613510.1 nucleotide-binding protein [Streptomyces europaeiscabiei]